MTVRPAATVSAFTTGARTAIWLTVASVLVLLVAACGIGGGGGTEVESAAEVAEAVETPEEAAERAAEQVTGAAEEAAREQAARNAAAQAAVDGDLPECNAVLAAHYQVVNDLQHLLRSVPSGDLVNPATGNRNLDELLRLTSALAAAPSAADEQATVAACGLLGAHQAAEAAWRDGDQLGACNRWEQAQQFTLDTVPAEMPAQPDTGTGDSTDAADGGVPAVSEPVMSPVVRRQLTAVRALVANRAARCP